jgi:hypothetical protein
MNSTMTYLKRIQGISCRTLRSKNGLRDEGKDLALITVAGTKSVANMTKASDLVAQGNPTFGTKWLKRIG